MKSLLIPIVGDDHVVDQPDILQRHGKDESFHQAMPPDLVVYPETNAQVSEIVRRCSERRCPVIPFGTGTSLEGQIAALQGGVCIDLSRMDQILALHASDLDCRVQAGITRSALNHELEHGGDACVRNQYGALRNDGGQHPWPDGCARRRSHHRNGFEGT